MNDQKPQPIYDDDEFSKIMPLFGDDLDLFLFYVSWLKNGLDAKAAYKELHPNVTNGSAKSLGSLELTKIDRKLVMEAYGLDTHLYLKQLFDGVQAEKRDQFSGEISPDHKTRQVYHDKLGKLLGWESDKPQTIVQNNQNNIYMSLEDFFAELKRRASEKKVVDGQSETSTE